MAVDARKVWTVYRKELLDLRRDRKTLFGMFVFPIVVFPLLTVGFGTLDKRLREKAKSETGSVMILGEENDAELARQVRAAEGIRVVPPAADFARRIEAKQLGAALEIPAGFRQQLDGSAGRALPLTIHYYPTEISSESVADRLEELTRRYRDRWSAAQLAGRGLPVAILMPLASERNNVADAQKRAGRRLGVLLPYLITFLCLVGAMAPAMDLTAGEKDRGTLETVLASAAGRAELVLGKFLLTATASLTTTVLSIGSFAGTALLARDYVTHLTGGEPLRITPLSVVWLFLMALPLTVLFSSVLMAVSLYARSFKEAQNYSGALVFVVLLPAVVSLLPGIELNAAVALVPIVNVSLVSKELLTGSAPLPLAALAWLASLVYAGIALRAATRLFESEAVLFRM